LENARSHLFDQWHFSMLNDKIRNKQFGDGIQKRIKELANGPIHVLDLGCGTGILTVMIAKELEKV
jgi:predicted RNA methylase